MHSPDGSWWWDGSRWIPAVSADGTQWFDGTTWRRVRRPPRSRARRVLTTTAIVLGSLVGFVASLLLYAWASGDAHDAFSLDDERIWEAAQVGCVGVTQALTAPGSDRHTRITSGNLAIEQLIAGVNALGRDRLADDEPAIDWLDDWSRLAVARAAFGEGLVDGKTVSSLEIPEVDGHPITERMISVAPAECNEAITTAAHP